MKIIRPSANLIKLLDSETIMKTLELFGRVCYKSEDKITEKSANKFIKMIIDKGHESILEHISVSARIICSRACSHQWVRHRIGTYSQESQRYCNYKKKGLVFINYSDEDYTQGFKEYLKEIEDNYNTLIFDGIKPEDARLILPNCTKTEFIVTYNLRQWRYFLKLRCDKHAQKEIRESALDLLDQFYTYLPIIFEDLIELKSKHN